jgi:uncharacterized iron-regulated protein
MSAWPVVTVARRRSRRTGISALFGALALAGCAGMASGTGAPPGKPLVIEPDAVVADSVQLVADRARTAEVVYLGELHDNAQHHAIQARILDALLAGGNRPALAFEMVPETRQAALDAAVRSNADRAEVDRQLEWSAQGWPDFAMYWPLFELARKNGLPVVAADIDPVVNRRISRNGLGVAGENPARFRSAMPDDPARDKAIAQRLRDAHCNQITESRALRMVESWYAQNVVMARHVGEALLQAPQVVVIMGRGHASPGAVPQQLAALRPGTRQFVVALFEGKADGPVEPLADVQWITPARSHPDPCLSFPQRVGGIPGGIAG